MKLPLLAASLLALGGCVAPGYYVQPDYSGSAYYDDSGYYGSSYYEDGSYYGGGYYGGGYYDGSDGYYPGYDNGCCGSASVSIGYGYGYGGYGYGYPGYYGWSGYPGGYGYYGGGYYGRGGHDHGDHDGDDHHGDGGHGGGHHDGQWWRGDHVDGAVKRWPSDRPLRDADRAPVPHWNAMAPSGNRPAPQPHMISPGGAAHFGPRIAPRAQPGAPGRTSPPARRAPRRSDSSSPKEF